MLSRSGGNERPAEAIFSTATRRVALVWILCAVGAAAIGGTAVHGERSYLIMWGMVGALIMYPVLIVAAVVPRRVSTGDRRFWQVWGVGLVGMLLVGAFTFVGAATQIVWFRYPSTA